MVSAAMEANSSLLETLEYLLGVKWMEPLPPPPYWGILSCVWGLQVPPEFNPAQLGQRVHFSHITSFWALVLDPRSGWDLWRMMVINCPWPPGQLGPVRVIRGIWWACAGGVAGMIAEEDPLLLLGLEHGGWILCRASGDGLKDLICKGTGHFSE